MNIITHFLCLMNLHFMFLKMFHQLSTLQSSKLKLYFPFQLLVKTQRDQKLDTLVNNLSNFKSCLLHLFVHLWLFCLLRQLIAHPIILRKEDGGNIATTTKSLGICAHLVFRYMKPIWDVGSQRHFKNLDLNCHFFKKLLYYYKLTMVHLPSNCLVIGKQTILSFSLKTIKVFLLLWCKL